jgi:hypothetical protein
MLPAVSEMLTAAPRDDEGRPLSRAAWAAALGISVRHLYRLLAAERAGVAEWAGPEAAPDPVPEAPPPALQGVERLPCVELVEAERSGWHYRLDADELSRLPAGAFRIGTGPFGRLRVLHRDDDLRVRDGDGDDEPASEGRCVNDLDRAAGVVYVQVARSG